MGNFDLLRLCRLVHRICVCLVSPHPPRAVHRRHRVLLAAIKSLTSLQDLCVSGNKLTALPHELGGLRQLQRLQADSNLITAIPGAYHIYSCSSLTHSADPALSKLLSLSLESDRSLQGLQLSSS